MRYVLAVDGGGSKCHVILARDDGELLGWAASASPPEGGAAPPVFGGRGRSAAVVLETVRKALGTRVADELHVGVVGPFPREIDTAGRIRRTEIHVIDEATAAFALAGMRDGICVLAGTGAFVHGRTRDGRTRHLDGLGPLLGDRGSGYEIGLRTIQAAARSGWHPRHRAAFAGAVLAACGGRADDRDGVSLIDYMAVPRDRSEIARFARVALTAAAAGDTVAGGIVREAAAALAETIYDVVDQLGLAQTEYRMIGTGGIIAHSDLYWEHLCALTRGFAPRLRPIRADLPPVAGIVLTVLERLPDVAFDSARERLFAACRARLQAAESSGTPASGKGG